MEVTPLRPFILLILSFLLMAAPCASGQTGCDSLCYSPEVLKDNVAFWEIIYQKIPSNQGLLHDQDTFRVIYDTIAVDDGHGRARRRSIGAREKQIEELLTRMASLDTSVWNDTMRRYAAKWGRPLRNDELLDAARRVRFQLGQKDHFIAGLRRSGRYMAQIKDIFRSYGLPEDLSYLPHVESSFNYRAYSKVGAAGIWQFMRNTGRLYMKVGYVIDERLDPIKATHAAAKLLRSNYKKLQSWPLALTAYNHGAASMERAVNQTGTTDIGVIIDNYQTRTWQFASKNFYASYLAARKTAINYKEYFGDLELEPPFSYAEYRLPKTYRPSYLAEAFGVSLKTLQDYNLDIRPTIFKANQYLPKDYELKLPVEFTASNTDSMVKKIPEKAVQEVLAQSGYHKVETGENLERIAIMYGVPLKDLLSLNNLSPEICIFPGQMIAIPSKVETALSTPPKETLPMAMAVPPQISPEAAKQATDSVKVSAAVPMNPDIAGKTAPMAAPSAIRSVPADTGKAPSIPAYLMAEKPVAPMVADSLQNLWSYLYSAALGLVLEGVRKCEFCEFNADYYDLDFVSESDKSVDIKVQIDETLGHYAEWSGISSAQIRSLNRISSSIYLGERLTLPISGETAQAFRKARIEHHMSIEEDFFNNYLVTGMDTVASKAGKNVWTLCQENDIPLWLFLKSNPDIKDLRSMRTGAILMPQVEEKK